MKGICFKEHLFNLVTKVTKTQTRRVINPQPIGETYSMGMQEDGTFKIGRATSHQYEYIRPRYQIGDKVYLKEPYFTEEITGKEGNKYYRTIYKYLQQHYAVMDNLRVWGCRDVSAQEKYELEHFPIEEPVQFRNKLFMPAMAARVWIEITNVKVQRLKEINFGDCINEGIKPYDPPTSLYPDWENGFSNGVDGIRYKHAISAYAELINVIDGKGTWESNPWVFVYDFKLTTKP